MTGASALKALSSQTILCLSHLRWNSVLQRPQHLMTRVASHAHVIFWEEPEYDPACETPYLRIQVQQSSGVEVATPILPRDPPDELGQLSALLRAHLRDNAKPLVKWYYTPMMLPFSRDIQASCTVYDCMDELANFRFAPDQLRELERQLFEAADVVFTGGRSLFESKRDKHAHVSMFPSAVDCAHFASREGGADPYDQAHIPHPRLGYYGVIDERIDLELIRRVAEGQPDWSIVMVGPTAKIANEDLPRRANVHYLGQKSYDQLPSYLAGWDVALMPFAINESTRFISPTKTPEYLAGHKPVVSTPILDVVRAYGDLDAVHVANPDGFVTACKRALSLVYNWHATNKRIAAQSWDATVQRMAVEILSAQRRAARALKSVPTRPHFDALVVGAGFAGAVTAERLARGLNKRVLVIDQRPHIAGNAYDFYNDAGIMMHQYGPHIFHTNSDVVFNYLSEFTAWRPYEHRVRARIDGMDTPIPINRTTLNMLFNAGLRTDDEAQAFLKSRAEPIIEIRTSEDVVIAAIGRELYEKFFRGYTRKQWGLDPSQLDKSVTARIPTRTNEDDRYFTDAHQAMPRAGYTALFEALLDHPRIEVQLGVSFDDVKDRVRYDMLFYTGPIDEYFGKIYGPLPYRSLAFRHETLMRPQALPVGTVNFPDESVPFTRVTEYKHLTGQQHPHTTLTFEYPKAEGDPFYPIPRAENHALFKRYEELSLNVDDVHFVGRLANYRYYNMDQVVGQAMSLARKLGDDSPKLKARSAA
jgi:UDP-galactopyranose mutase